MGLKMMLKALGVNFNEQDIARIEAMIPKLPEVTIAVLNRISAMWQQQQEMNRKLDEILERMNKQDAERGVRYLAGTRSTTNGHDDRRSDACGSD